MCHISSPASQQSFLARAYTKVQSSSGINTPGRLPVVCWASPHTTFLEFVLKHHLEINGQWTEDERVEDVYTSSPSDQDISAGVFKFKADYLHQKVFDWLVGMVRSINLILPHLAIWQIYCHLQPAIYYISFRCADCTFSLEVIFCPQVALILWRQLWACSLLQRPAHYTKYQALQRWDIKQQLSSIIARRCKHTRDKVPHT